MPTETNGVNGNPSNTQTPRNPFDELPYFQEYLQTILRPKIEKTMETMDRLLTEAAWRHITSTVAADQHLPPELASTIVRPLLEQKLGLKLQARLESQFGVPSATPGGPTPTQVDLGEGVTRGPDGAEILTVRRRPMNNPIANAVVSNTRPMGR